MSVEGSLDLFSLPEILQMISQQGKTGILTIQGQQDIVAISFLAGRIVAADSLAHTVEEGLAKVLVGEGLLSAAELARAGAEHQASGGRLLDLLVERRYLTRPQLLAALRLQTIRQLESLLRWQVGDFKFYGGDEVSYEEGFQPISVEDLLLRTLADFAGPPSPQAPPRPPSAPAATAAATARGGAAAGPAAVVPRPSPGAAGDAAGDRRPERGTRATGVDFRLPEVPDVPKPPEMSPSAAPHGAAPPLAVPRRSPAPPLSPVPVPPAAAGGPLGAAAPGATATRDVGAPVLDPPGKRPAASAAPSLPFPAPSPTAPAAPAAAADDLAAAAAAAPAPTPGSPPASEPVPWPAAALVSPPVPPAPARPRATATGLVKPPGLPAPGGPILAPAPAARAGTLWTPAGVPPDAPPAGSAGRSGALPAAGGRRPATVEGQSAAAEDRRAISPGGLAPESGPLPSRFRQMQVERPGRLVPLAHRLAATGLGVAVAAALVVAARQAPEHVLLSLPWEQGERAAFVRNQRECLYGKIETAAKTACLRDGRFPDQLAQLRDSGLLSAADLTDPGGEPLVYSVREDGYTLQATDGGKPLADADTSGSSVGNFLLDPSFSQTSPQKGPPIVLLD